MCVDPVSLTLIASTAISAAGAVATGISKNAEATANAAALESSAQQRQEKAKFDIATADRRYRRQAGEVEAKIGATGIDVSSFSNVLADDAKESALEKKAIQIGADVEAANLRFQAQGQKMQAKSAIVTAGFGVAGAIAGGYAKSAQIDAYNAKGANLGGVAIDPFGN